MVLAAFAVPPGSLAAVLTLPWLAFTLLIATSGLIRLLSRASRPVAELCVDAGMFYLAIGGIWLFLTRAGARPMGFQEPIVLLTAAHFHYAGFLLPLLTGKAVGKIGGQGARLAGFGVMFGAPLVAIGIAFSPWLEGVAAWILAAAGFFVAVLQLRLAARCGDLTGRLLLGMSAFSLMAGMALAAVYGLRMHLEFSWLTIPRMIRIHANLNAIGFTLPALLAHNRIETREHEMDGAQ
jgi:hypothetical protein